ncbi:MAG TPA: hypothetical protein VGE15_08310, partial [Sphingobacteriaceae bacterium]
VYSHPQLGNWTQPFLNAVAEDVSAQMNKPRIYLLTDPGNELIATLGAANRPATTGKDSYYQ